jgi:hypothetical protein
MRPDSTILMPLEVGQEQGILTVDVCAANALLHGSAGLFWVENDPFQRPARPRDAKPNLNSLMLDLNRSVRNRAFNTSCRHSSPSSIMIPKFLRL